MTAQAWEVAMRTGRFSRKLGEKQYEQRAEMRYPLSSMVTWRCGDDQFTGQTLDIGRGGMKIKCRNRVPAKELVYLTTLGAIPINMSGQVKWVSRIDGSYRFGIEFVSVTRDQLRYLEENCLDDLEASY